MSSKLNKLAIIYTDSITHDDDDDDYQIDISDIVGKSEQSNSKVDQNIEDLFEIVLDDSDDFEQNVSRQDINANNLVTPGYSRLSVSRSKRMSDRILASSSMGSGMGSRVMNPLNTMARGTSRLTQNIPMTTVRSMPWLQTPMTVKRTKNQPKKKEQLVVAPLFEEFSKNIEDPFWIDIFKTCSYGKMPSGVSFRNNVLTVKKGTQTYNLEVDNNPSIGAQQCVEFIRDHGDLKSEKDLKDINEKIDRTNNNVQRVNQMTWKQIRNKKLKKALIIDYVYRIKNERNLTIDQLNNLKTQINLGLNLGLFNHEHIVFEKGSIVDIIGLKWDYNNEEFYIDRSATNQYKPPRTKNTFNQEIYLDPNYKIIAPCKYVDFGTVWSKTSKSFPIRKV